MKIKYSYSVHNKKIEKEISYIPVRYSIAILIAIIEILAIIGVAIWLCCHNSFFYLIACVIQFACVITIIASDDNPDYKIPWLLFVIILPIVGFMLYFMFYSRKLKRKYVRRLNELKNSTYTRDDSALLSQLQEENPIACSQAKMLCNISESHLYSATKQRYFPSGEEMFGSMLEDLKAAKDFIYLEYFIIEEGKFWNTVLEILKEKVSEGVNVKLIYDDIGCMTKLPGNYAMKLRKYGIEATVFSYLRGNADSEFNNRNHRKIFVIDGKVAYTGGINLADEYININSKFGHWKDTGVRLEGEAVWELTKLFLIDFGINVIKMPEIKEACFPKQDIKESGYMVPFGDGPRPLYKWRVGKTVIQNMLATATKYVYMTSPYLIIDNGLCQSIENAALRGVDVRIVVPHIPDKKLVFLMTRSFYHRLMEAGVKIYEYEPGFIHAKSYLADDEYAMIGSINLDYRSLVHHFENGIWMYKCKMLSELKEDIDNTIAKSILVTDDMLKTSLFQRFIRSVVRIFAPLL